MKRAALLLLALLALTGCSEGLVYNDPNAHRAETCRDIYEVRSDIEFASEGLDGSDGYLSRSEFEADNPQCKGLDY